jgi:hypothetical protein
MESQGVVAKAGLTPPGRRAPARFPSRARLAPAPARRGGRRGKLHSFINRLP